jgi:SAM-dependent methyltransferase
MNDREKIINRYVERFKLYGPDPIQTLKPGSPEHYKAQHQTHIDSLPSNISSVLDVGCGLGNFRRSLNDSSKFFGKKINYTGIDIVPEFINYGKNEFEEDEFFLGTLDEYCLNHKENFDAVVFCQIFNNRYEDTDNFEVVMKSLELAFSVSNRVVSCDLIGNYVNFEEPFLYYFSQEKLFSYAKSLTPFVKLDNSYSEFHFTISLYRGKL